MSLLARLLGRTSPGSSLVGTWQKVDDPSVKVVFFPDGRLEFRSWEGEKLQIITLTYRVECGEIVSNQPSAPREELTEFRLVGGNTLVLTYAAEQTRYERAG